ncbi:MAG: transcription antitermination factor NusB [Candidatus Peribacteraceae bacterium]|nr:transcription antitermination factor NusB [Candidatus Peribacteraceae bacterium]
MQVLFELERRDTNPKEALERNISELSRQFGDVDKDFAEDLLNGVMDKHDDLITSVESDASDWSFSRMDPIARCILLIGAYELLFGKDAPSPVVINESIEIAKEYGSAETGKFVNGVLNAIAHR